MQGGEAMSAIGALDYSKEERRRLAKSYVCHCSVDVWMKRGEER